jgi:hypothetical protein
VSASICILLGLDLLCIILAFLMLLCVAQAHLVLLELVLKFTDPVKIVVFVALPRYLQLITRLIV